MANNAELREFLRTRRARVRPEDVGIETGGRRRVPGLRREEVAMLAGVSTDYYTRLEQGRRRMQPSDQVLDALARALRLADVERRHLHRLVRSSVAAAAPDGPRLPPLDEGMRMMLDSMPMPAMVIDSRGDVHAMNRLGRALLVGLEPMPSQASSHVRWLFLDPAARELLVEWEVIARVSVGVLREAAGRYPRDARLREVVGELSLASAEFRGWWAEHEVEVRCRGMKRFRHPVVGALELHVEALRLEDGERWVYAYGARAGSASEEGLRLLGAWGAGGFSSPLPPLTGRL
ncbi:helix-turn-helix domain-containing protein [Streptomyces sp. NBC_00670]|uniref:helix-turn-helix domain-containing protein n=1 Tax=Streptomyces sp. NBC_00670 TaxID=2975804 RepID=UPI002E33D1A0|nr:helix-turn-helix transcriptional regulator [Streptomyces sp. NBC_00670]